MKRVLVIGSTGRLGSRVVDAALAAGHEVTALARDPSAVEVGDRTRLRVVRGDVRDITSLRSALAGHDVAVSCLGPRKRSERSLRTEGMRNITAAASAAGVSRLVALSAFGVGDSLAHLRRTTFVFSRIILPVFLKAQFEDMARMEELVRETELESVIVRPSALTDKPATHAVKVASEDDKAGSAIPMADVADFMVQCLEGDRYVGSAPVIYA